LIDKIVLSDAENLSLGKLEKTMATKGGSITKKRLGCQN
jgi:hypothetical protein